MADTEKKPLLVVANSDDHSPTRITSCGLFLIQLATGIYFLADCERVMVVPQYLYDRVARQGPFYSNITTGNSSVCGVNTSDPVFQAKQDAQETTARWRLYTSLADNLIGTLACIVLGSSSDRIGRRWMFVIPTIGVCAKMLMYAANSYWSMPLWTLLIGHFLNGLSGGSSTVILAAILCMADVTGVSKRRTVLITLVAAITGVLASLSDFGSGYLIQHLDYTGTFLITAGIAAINSVTIFAMPETVPRPTNKKTPTTYVKDMFIVYVKKSDLRLLYLIVLVTFSSVNLVIAGREGIRTLYTINAPFCWNSVKIGVVNGIFDIAQPVASVICVKVLQMCMSDSEIGAIGTVLVSSAFVTMALATKDIHLYIASGLRFPVFFIREMLRSILSKLTPPTKQGVTLSSLSAQEAAATLVGGLLFNAVYEGTVNRYRGAVFLLMAAIIGASTFGLVALHFLISRRRPTSTSLNSSHVHRDAS